METARVAVGRVRVVAGAEPVLAAVAVAPGVRAAGERALHPNNPHYHSQGTPPQSDPNFAALTPAQRITLAKLAAIIRVADAVDRSHLQKATIRDIALSGEELIITVTSDQDISLEEWTFLDKADFFENVFGIRPILQRQVESHHVR